MPRHLERGLDPLGTAAEEINPIHARRRGGDKVVGEFLNGLGREEAGMGERQAVDLFFDRPAHVGIAVTQC